jgi:hypothetical protein
MLSHSCPLGLAHRLLYVEPLPFCRVSSKGCELILLKTVLESSPHVWMPLFSNFTVYSSPQIMLVHHVANAIPLGLHVTGQEVPQKLICVGNCLVVSLLGFFEHLLGLLNLQLADLHVILGQDGSLGPSRLLEILQHSGQLVNSLDQLPALHVESLLADEM